MTLARSVPPLARRGFDRAAHLRRDAAWQAAARLRAKVVVVDEGRVLVRDDGLAFVSAADVVDGSAELYFLGLDEEQVPYFAVPAKLPTVDGARIGTLRELGHS